VERVDSDFTTGAAVFSCSPRPAGNSDLAADLFTRGVVQAGGEAQQLVLRKFKISPCVGCCRCEHDAGRRCYLAKKDQSATLFTALQRAPLVFFSSPIYFYHLPAVFKGFIDRGQSYYLRLRVKDPALVSLPRRKAYVALVAGRLKGENLFKGSLLTLKYFLAPFQLELAEPQLLTDIDAQDDLANNSDAQQRIVSYGEAAWIASRETRTGEAPSAV
jgi:multimeric flavodoxin WrbA